MRWTQLAYGQLLMASTPDIQERATAAPSPAPAQQVAGEAPATLPATGAGVVAYLRGCADGQRAEIVEGVQRTAGNQAVGRLLAREPAPDGGTPAPDGGAKTPVSAPGWATPEFKRTLAAVVLAESADGQETDIRWIYLQRVTAAGGKAGLKGSAAYSGKGIWYRIWLQVLGDTTHGGDVLPAKKEFEDFKGQTIADFCTKNGWIKTVAEPRASRMVTLVDELFTAPEHNPYKGWEGQGNLRDFNNESNNDDYWKRARAYYWLQQAGKVTDIYVKVLPAGGNTQVLFDAKSIAKYWTGKKLPADVPKYAP